MRYLKQILKLFLTNYLSTTLPEHSLIKIICIICLMYSQFNTHDVFNTALY